MPKLGTAKYSPQKQREDDSVKALREILPSDRIDTSHIWEANFANSDGRLELINEHREYSGLKFEIQIKALHASKSKRPTFHCSKKFLKYCSISNTPVFIFAVDVTNKILHWEHLSSAYVKGLKIKKKQKGKTIIFDAQKKIPIGSDLKYLEAWELICKKYVDVSEIEQQMELLQQRVEVNQSTEKSVNRMLYQLGKSIGRKSYDEMLNDFSFLDGLIYFKTEKDYPVADFIINLSNRFGENFGHQVIFKTPFVDVKELPGKSEDDVINGYLELLQKIRYLKVKEIFNILVEFFSRKERVGISEKAKKIIEELVEYNLYVLQKVGYYPQHAVLEVIEKWDTKRKLENVELICLIANKVLEASFEGRSMTDYKTLTFSSGALNPSKNLIKIRKRTLSILEELFISTKDVKNRLLILRAMSQASHQPSHGTYGDEVIAMITKDIQHLTSFYKKLIEKNPEAPVIQEIERQLAWSKRLLKDKVPQSSAKLLQNIRGDRFYGLYRLFVGRDFDYIDDQEDFSTVEQKINQEIENTSNSISATNISKYVKDFKNIAHWYEVKEDWEFHRFKEFLEKLAKTKSGILSETLSSFLDEQSPLFLFTGSILRGFRMAGKYDLLNKSFKQIASKKKLVGLKAIVISLIGMDKNFMRLSDLKIISEMATHTNEYKFLNTIDKSELRDLHYLIMRTLVWTYAYDWKKSKATMVKMIKRDTDLTPHYLNELSTALYSKRVTFQKWSAKDLQLLLDVLVKVEQLDYHIQGILTEIVGGNLDAIINLLLMRIKFEQKQKKKRKSYLDRDSYRAVPHDLNENLLKTIKAHPKYSVAIKKLIAEVKKDKKDIIYGWQVSQLIDEITKFDSVLNLALLDSVKNGGKDDFVTVLRILEHFNGGNEVLKICLEIVKRTQDNKIWQRCIGAFYRMGVVMGEHGISEGYKTKLEETKLLSPTNKHQKKFLVELQSSLEKEIVSNRKREDQSEEERQKDFEMEA